MCILVRYRVRRRVGDGRALAGPNVLRRDSYGKERPAGYSHWEFLSSASLRHTQYLLS